jgi:hypothetical protein
MISENFFMLSLMVRSVPLPSGLVPFLPRTVCLPKIILQNLWPITRRTDLILKKAQFVYAICLRLPFCLRKHILGVMLVAHDENNTSLPFGCFLTQIILQSGISVAGEPKMKVQNPISKQMLMKSNAQLRREDKDDDPQPPHIHVAVPDMASSSQTAPPPPQQDTRYAQILEALVALQGALDMHILLDKITSL